MFRRRKRAQEEPVAEAAEFVDDLDDEDRAYEDALLLREIEQQERDEALLSARADGPWDADAVPDDDDLPRLDLGSLRVPVPPEVEVRVEVSPEGEVVAATFVAGDGVLQVGVFAAPRTEGIWDEVRTEIADSLRASGGQAEEVPSEHGTELRAGVPTEVPGHGVLLAPARFVGVDGPRWFLRALYTGSAAVDPEAAAPLEAALRDVVVVRGTQPMAVRDPLPMRLPPEAQQTAEEYPDDGDEELGGDPLPMPERGPETTETR
ncbi:MAG: DUF3710 domain-containing protein [Actinomycetota bacterium]|nr:DUF3710 domain-containing protein [Actinomycetota bacterium]